MSIFIKGVDMPEGYVDIRVFADGTVKSYNHNGLDVKTEKNAVVEVSTPHGDLIDRTKLYNDTANWESQALEQVDKYDPSDSRDEWRWWSAVLKERSAFKFDIADAPAVIEAEEKE